MSNTQDGSARKNGGGLGEPEVRGGAPMDELRVGLVAGDPLRVLGLQMILEGAYLTVAGARRKALVVHVTVPMLRRHSELALVMIDAGCTDRLMELLATLRRERPQMGMVVIGDSGEPEYIERAIGAGAKGYLTREASEAEIRMALEMVCEGSVWAPRKVLSRLLDHRAEPDAGRADREIRFTAREVQVLRFLVSGMANREIAAELGIDESTVKAHLSRLMRKVGAKNRIELTLQVLQHRFTERRVGVTLK